MPDGVIAAVEAKSEADQQSILVYGALVFKMGPGIIVEDKDEAPIIIEEQEVNNSIGGDLEDAPKDIISVENEDEGDDGIGLKEAAEDNAIEDKEAIHQRPSNHFFGFFSNYQLCWNRVFTTLYQALSMFSIFHVNPEGPFANWESGSSVDNLEAIHTNWHVLCHICCVA
jgi:hypothetical protein